MTCILLHHDDLSSCIWSATPLSTDEFTLQSGFTLKIFALIAANINLVFGFADSGRRHGSGQNSNDDITDYFQSW